MILDTSTVDGDVKITAEVCVIGSGAGGSVVAAALAQAGRSVVVVEQGSYQTGRDFTQREEEMYPRLYQGDEAQVASDAAVLVCQGRTVGGSTVTSFCVCARPPRRILDNWQNKLGLPGAGADAMTPHYQRVEQAIQVREVAAEQVNKNNQVVEAGAGRLGFHTTRLAHNLVNCLGCGYCALGCAYDRKADALTIQLRQASQHGAVIVPDCRVEQVTTAGSRVSGVTGTFRRAGAAPATLSVRAKVVVLAAGAIASPQIWLRSRLPNTNRQVGRNLHLHPQVLVAGIFDEEIAGWRGIPQSVVVDQFLGESNATEGGFLLSPMFAHPVAMAALLPGFGADYRRLLDLYPRIGLAAVMLHDRSSGSVEVDGSGRASVNYALGDDDRATLVDGIHRLADVYFAAGAERVVLPFNDLVELTRRGDYRGLEEHSIRANDPILLSLHPQGSMRMGSNPQRSVVNGTGEAHSVRGLFVADASVFPSAVAVPPQLSVMAFADRTAQYIEDNRGAYFG